MLMRLQVAPRMFRYCYPNMNKILLVDFFGYYFLINL